MPDENELSEYEVEINGIPTTLQLSAEDAERYGDAAKKVSAKSRAASNKARTAENK